VNRALAWPHHSLIALPARLYLAAVFLLACVHKIAEPHSFALDVATYQILPLWSVNAVALWLPWVELAAALSLVLGFRARAGAWLVALMMAVFLVAIGSALARGLDLSCGCFASQGVAEDPISWKTVVRDAAWLLLALYVLFFDESPLGLDRWLSARKARHAAPF
jgi:putative oxidoreductase